MSTAKQAGHEIIKIDVESRTVDAGKTQQYQNIPQNIAAMMAGTGVINNSVTRRFRCWAFRRRVVRRMVVCHFRTCGLSLHHD